MQLQAKAILITGASGGIGAALARRLAAEGAKVGVGYHQARDAAQTLARELGGVALGFDVQDSSAVEQAVAQFRSEAGRLDGLVNAAGVHYAALLVNADEARTREQVGVNLLGSISCTRAVLPAFLEQRSGVIVNVSSVAAVSPQPGGAVYAATKAALEAFTRAIALEYGKKGIRSVCVRPGPTETSMLDTALALGGDRAKERTALRRLASPEQVAGLVSFLLSDDASYVTGSVHAVDGGYT